MQWKLPYSFPFLLCFTLTTLGVFHSHSLSSLAFVIFHTPKYSTWNSRGSCYSHISLFNFFVFYFDNFSQLTNVATIKYLHKPVNLLSLQQMISILQYFFYSSYIINIKSINTKQEQLKLFVRFQKRYFHFKSVFLDKNRTPLWMFFPKIFKSFKNIYIL